MRILILFFITYNFVSFAQLERSHHNHPFSQTLALSVIGGASIGITDLDNSRPGFSGGGMIEYFIPTYTKSTFGLRLQLTGSIVNTKTTLPEIEYKTDVYLLGGGISYLYSISEVVFPYVYSGISYLEFYPNLGDGSPAPNRRNRIYTPGSFAYNLELGSRFALTSKLSMLFNFNYLFIQTDYLDDINVNDNYDKYLTINAGISFSLFGTSNSDNDMLTDDEDLCPEETEDYDGYSDDDGCPDFDNDSDGMPDAKDECPDLAEDVDGFEDYDGCPEYDNDGDNIFDNIDDCSNLPEDFDGFEDEDGCPDFDNDKDGILDGVDKCSNVSEDFDGFEDADGCPDLDNDNDLIRDEEDRCPDQAETFNGVEDDDGCPDESTLGDSLKVKKEKPKIINENLPPVREKNTTVLPTSPSKIILDAVFTFEDDKSVLKSSAYKELDEIAETIKKNPNTKWRIEGHSDKADVENGFANLSGKRAREVMLYLVVKKGVPFSQLEVIDLKAKYPRVKSERLSSRALNRRVEIIKVK